MRNTMTSKIICLAAAALFLFNDLCYGLSPMLGTTKPGVKDSMYAAGQKLFAAQYGPGAVGEALEEYRPIVKFKGKELLLGPAGKAHIKHPNYQTEFINADYKSPPKGWENNPILKVTDLVSAFKMFRNTEAQIPSDRLDIVEGWFPADESSGELPIARIEPMPDGKYTLVLHTKFVQMWNHIRANDVWFELNMGKNKRRTVSVAWGIFYRVAKHEMTDLIGSGHFSKSLGHIDASSTLPRRDEKIASGIRGNHSLINDSVWLWFLGSYCFGDNARYDNDTFLDRMRWFFTGDKARELGLPDEFPNLEYDNNRRPTAEAFACAINYNFFTRPEVRAFKTLENMPVEQKFMDEYSAREEARKKADITEKPIPTTGNDKPQQPAAENMAKSEPAKPAESPDGGKVFSDNPAKALWLQELNNTVIGLIEDGSSHLDDITKLSNLWSEFITRCLNDKVIVNIDDVEKALTKRAKISRIMTWGAVAYVGCMIAATQGIPSIESWPMMLAGVSTGVYTGIVIYNYRKMGNFEKLTEYFNAARRSIERQDPPADIMLPSEGSLTGIGGFSIKQFIENFVPVSEQAGITEEVVKALQSSLNPNRPQEPALTEEKILNYNFNRFMKESSEQTSHGYFTNGIGYILRQILINPIIERAETNNTGVVDMAVPKAKIAPENISDIKPLAKLLYFIESDHDAINGFYKHLGEAYKPEMLKDDGISAGYLCVVKEKFRKHVLQLFASGSVTIVDYARGLKGTPIMEAAVLNDFGLKPFGGKLGFHSGVIRIMGNRRHLKDGVAAQYELQQAAIEEIIIHFLATNARGVFPHSVINKLSLIFMKSMKRCDKKLEESIVRGAAMREIAIMVETCPNKDKIPLYKVDPKQSLDLLLPSEGKPVDGKTIKEVFGMKSQAAVKYVLSNSQGSDVLAAIKKGVLAIKEQKPDLAPKFETHFKDIVVGTMECLRTGEIPLDANLTQPFLRGLINEKPEREAVNTWLASAQEQAPLVSNKVFDRELKIVKDFLAAKGIDPSEETSEPEKFGVIEVNRELGTIELNLSRYVGKVSSDSPSLKIISSIEGLEGLKTITVLWLRNNPDFTDISPAKTMPNLEELHIAGSGITAEQVYALLEGRHEQYGGKDELKVAGVEVPPGVVATVSYGNMKKYENSQLMNNKPDGGILGTNKANKPPAAGEVNAGTKPGRPNVNGKSPADARVVLTLSRLKNFTRGEYKKAYEKIVKKYPELKFEPNISMSTVGRDLKGLVEQGVLVLRRGKYRLLVNNTKAGRPQLFSAEGLAGSIMRNKNGSRILPAFVRKAKTDASKNGYKNFERSLVFIGVLMQRIIERAPTDKKLTKEYIEQVLWEFGISMNGVNKPSITVPTGSCEEMTNNFNGRLITFTGEVKFLQGHPYFAITGRGTGYPLVELLDDGGYMLGDATVVLPKDPRAKADGGPQQHPIELAPFEYSIRLGPNEDLLSNMEIENIFKTIGELDNNQIELFVPQRLKLTEAMKQFIKDIGKKRCREGCVVCREYSDLHHLAKLLREGLSNVGIKRMVLTDISGEMEQAKFTDFIREYPEIFRSGRLLNIAPPANYMLMDNIERTVYQAKMITIGILARLFEGDKTPMVEAVLRAMLKGCVDLDEAGLKRFLSVLGRENDGAGLGDEDLINRILYLCGNTIKLVEKIGREIQFMKTFRMAA